MKIRDVEQVSFRLLQGDPDRDYTAVCYDSRRIEPGCLFVCMKGMRFDPHDIIAKLAAAGAKGVVTEHECSCPEGIDVWRTDDSRAALAHISAAFFGFPARRMTMIAVTGTKGKTTTAGMIRRLLEAAGHKTGLIGTLGISVGDEHTPLNNTTPESFELHRAFAHMVQEGCTHVVMEASSQAVLMHRIDGIDYDIGVFTNISNDHIGPGEHKDFQDYLDCKTRVISQCRKAFLNADDEHTEYVRTHTSCPDLTGFGFSEHADCRITGQDVADILVP